MVSRSTDYIDEGSINQTENSDGNSHQNTSDEKTPISEGLWVKTTTEYTLKNTENIYNMQSSWI